MATTANPSPRAQSQLHHELGTAVRPRELVPARFEEIERAQQRAPRFAHARAHAAFEMARRTRNFALRARAELALIQTLNTLGEFPDALALCVNTAARFEKFGDTENSARVWLEAATSEMWRGNLDDARAYLARANGLHTTPAMQIQVNLIQGRIARNQSQFKQAGRLFQAALSKVRADDRFHAALLLREFGATRQRLNPSEGMDLLQNARRQFARQNCATQVAWCDLFIGQAFADLSRFPESETTLRRVKRFAVQQHMRFLAALCDLDVGVLRWYQQRFQDALALQQAARAVFVELGAIQEISSCEINIGSDLCDLNRHAEAIPFLENAARVALDTQRHNKAGVAHSNLGELYNHLGNYPRALYHHATARELFAHQNAVMRLAECDLVVAGTHANLGQFTLAARAFRRARKMARKGKLPSVLARAELGLGQIALQRGHSARARKALHHAKKRFAQLEQPLYVAYCERLLAQTSGHVRKRALQHLSTSQKLFARQNLFVDVALCELVRGDLYCAWKHWAEAERAYRRAQNILEPAFPDHAWRIAYGLGKIARARGDETGALREWLRGCEMIAKLRAGIGLESWSNELFHARQRIFLDALKLAQRLARQDAVLRVMEIAKAQTFLQQVIARAAPSAAIAPAANVVERERLLRERIKQQRRQLLFDTAHAPTSLPWLSRGAQVKTIGTLQASLREYEEVAQQLYLMRQGLKGNPSLALFDVQEFRAYANARWGDAWTALDYFFANGNLYLACIEPTRVAITTTRWTPFDAAQLQLATSTHPDERELVYNNTLHGFPVAAPVEALTYLTPRLIPASVRERRAQTLILAPHYALHQLPFHALRENQADTGNAMPLLEHFTFVYTPNLQALVELARHPLSKRKRARTLVCGAESFSDLPSLRHTRAEVAQLTQFPNTTALWQEDATRATLMEWNAHDALEKFTTLHFATHARVDADAPYESHIALTDGTLNVLDLADLKLDARLVTLSACASALGKGGSGDESLGLVRAFFSAGARAVVASLWNVDDASTAALMKLFYENLETGKAIAQALREAQRALYRQGSSAYHWAAFVAMGQG